MSNAGLRLALQLLASPVVCNAPCHVFVDLFLGHDTRDQGFTTRAEGAVFSRARMDVRHIKRMEVAETKKQIQKERRVYVDDGGHLYVKAEELFADPDIRRQLEEANALAEELGLKRKSDDELGLKR